MKADEIRNLIHGHAERIMKVRGEEGPDTIRLANATVQVSLLGEIAAQLAELNERLDRCNQDNHHPFVEEYPNE